MSLFDKFLANKSARDRRQFLQRSLTLGVGLGSLPVLYYLQQKIGWTVGEKKVWADGTRPRRLAQIFLSGAWDTALAIDPVVGSKTSSSTYESYYINVEKRTVSGKDLIVGEGLFPALEAFALLPTAFVNGLYVEVTAHELASDYLLTGRQTLSRNSKPTAYIARIAAAKQHFPPHIVLGGVLPLGDTAVTAPPMVAGNVIGLQTLLTNPIQGMGLSPESSAPSEKLISQLNELRYGREPSHEIAAAWAKGAARLSEVYSQNYRELLDFSDAIKTRYNTDGAATNPGAIAGLYLTLASGLSPFVSTYVHGFDTHTEGIATQKERLQSVFYAINALCKDLRATPDPTDSTLSLADTTTIVISSEFSRTPTFNNFGGTDHWPSASLIVMGQGVRDNTVLGKTGDDAKALGWQNGSSVVFTSETQLLPDHFVAALLQNFGLNEAADEVSTKKLAQLFV